MAKRTKPEVAETPVRFDVFNIKKYNGRDGDERSFWTKIGAAFPHKDGKGFNVEIDLLPIDGKLTLRQYDPQADDAE